MTLFLFNSSYQTFWVNVSWPLYDRTLIDVTTFGTLQIAIISYYLSQTRHTNKSSPIDQRFWVQVAFVALSTFIVFQSTVGFFRGPLGIEPGNWSSKIGHRLFEVETNIIDLKESLAYASDKQSKASKNKIEDIVDLEVQVDRLRRLEQIESQFNLNKFIDRSERGFLISSRERYLPVIMLVLFHICLVLRRFIRFEELKSDSALDKPPLSN